jgi:hypothetical protein
VNIAGPLATLIFAITVITVFGGLFAYGVYKARERTRKKPASTKKVLQFFVEYALPSTGGTDNAIPSPPLEGGRGALVIYLALGAAAIGLAMTGLYYYRSGRRLVRQGVWAVGTEATKEFPGPPPPRRPNRGAPVSFAKLAGRRASFFPKASLDANGDGVLQMNERARLQADVPQTILVTVDDNGHAQGLRWLFEAFDKYGIWSRSTFFITGNYGRRRPSFLGGPIDAWWSCLSNENFVGIHGQTHEGDTEGWSVERWLSEDGTTLTEISTEVQAPEGWAWESYPWGSRAPFLFFTDAYFAALERVTPRVPYDTSMVVHPSGPARFGPRDVPWPFSLDTPLPPEVELPYSEEQHARVVVAKHALIEVPIYAWAVRVKGGTMTWLPSLDVNVFKELGCSGDGANAEVVDVFEENLKAHYEGNRAPFHLGLHAQNYTADRTCERATLDAILGRVQRYSANGWRLQYQSLPRLLEWLASE